MLSQQLTVGLAGHSMLRLPDAAPMLSQNYRYFLARDCIQ
jgi:hypothetical protein